MTMSGLFIMLRFNSLHTSVTVSFSPQKDNISLVFPIKIVVPKTAYSKCLKGPDKETFSV